jgi:hypothetical protein
MAKKRSHPRVAYVRDPYILELAEEVRKDRGHKTIGRTIMFLLMERLAQIEFRKGLEEGRAPDEHAICGER